MSENAFDPIRAATTWGMQWCFFSAYLVALFGFMSPWGSENRGYIASYPTRVGLGKSPVVFFLALFIFTLYILSDFRVIGVPGLASGGWVKGDPPSLPGLLGTPFLNPLMMAFYSRRFPLADAIIYYGLAKLIINFPDYLTDRPGGGNWDPSVPE